MNAAVQISKCLAMLAIAVLCVVTAQEIRDFQVNLLGEVDTQGAATREMFTEQVAVLARVTDARLASIQGDLNTQITKTRTAAVEQIGFTRADLVTQISLTRATLDSQLTATNASVSRAVTGLETVEAPAALAVGQINAGLPLYLDCDAGECFASKFYGIAQSFEKLSASSAKIADVVAKEAPATAEAFRGTAVDIHREADEFTRKKRWYERILGPVVGGLRALAAFL